MSVRIEIRSALTAGQSSSGQAIVRSAAALGISTLRECRIVRLYFLEHDPGEEAIQRLCAFAEGLWRKSASEGYPATGISPPGLTWTMTSWA